MGLSLRPRPLFNLTQSNTELEMFEALQNHLGVGRLQKNRNNVTLVVTSINEIVSVLIPLFDKYPLHGSKLTSYQVFKKVSLMMKAKKHLTLEGTLQILELAYFMNPGTTLRTIESKEVIYFKNKTLIKNYGKLPIIPEIKLPELNLPKPINLEFIRGEVDGDGSFNVSFRTDRRRIGVNFTVIHELSDLSVLNEIQQFFKCGSVYILKSKAARFQVQTVDEILNNIEPIFKNIKFYFNFKINNILIDIFFLKFSNILSKNVKIVLKIFLKERLRLTNESFFFIFLIIIRKKRLTLIKFIK